jgi:TolA-binding protein
MLTLGVLVWFCMRRIRKKPRLSLRPEGYILSPSEDERGVGGVPHGQPPVAPQLRGEKSRSPDSDLNPHESLAEQLHAMRSQLAELSGVGTDVEHALQQNEALRARIRALENELQSQTGSELRSGQSPPGYTAIPGVIGF